VVVSSYDHRPDHASIVPAPTIENATYCRIGDDKRPEIVGTIDVTTIQMCPADLMQGASEVTDALPGIQANVQGARGGLVTPVSGWYARVMFANLLDPNIEDLIPNKDGTTQTGSLANTQPFTLTCGGLGVAYDGYYSPSGNALTYPVGPSLFVAPLDATAIPGGSECMLAIKPNAVRNKAGLVVPSANSGLGPFSFKTAQIRVTGSTPACGGNLNPCQVQNGGTDLTAPPMIDPTTASLVITWDGALDTTTLTPAKFSLSTAGAGMNDCTARVPQTAKLAPDTAANAIDITDANAPGTNTFQPGQTYVFTLTPGQTVKDLALGDSQPLPAPSDFTVCFQT
jgi:hypothetical protein